MTGAVTVWIVGGGGVFTRTNGGGCIGERLSIFNRAFRDRGHAGLIGYAGISRLHAVARREVVMVGDGREMSSVSFSFCENIFGIAHAVRSKHGRR